MAAFLPAFRKAEKQARREEAARLVQRRFRERQKKLQNERNKLRKLIEDHDTNNELMLRRYGNVRLHLRHAWG